MAIKVLRIPSDNKAAIVQELQREIDLMRSLNHPNIVRYLGAEVDTQNNILNIFQEWVAGGSVSSLLKQLGPFSLAVVRSYTTQILQGLDYLHSNHIIHRDIKVRGLSLNVHSSYIPYQFTHTLNDSTSLDFREATF